MLFQCLIGHPIHDEVSFKLTYLPEDVQKYADIMRRQYKHQPIVATDWPPRIGQDFFGKLALVEKKDLSKGMTKHQSSAWYMLRGQVDKIVEMSGNKEISIMAALQPSHSSLSARVVIDGPPGIGKTTLCRKLLNMWANGLHQYDLVLYCPLRNSKIATATSLDDLFFCRRYEVPNVSQWFEKRNGEGLLIIFDGWDELSTQLRQSSLAAKIIFREQLDQCSVIVTSRSYASSSLSEMPSLTRHVQVIGFSEEEILTVIIQTLQNNEKLAKELIEENTLIDNSAQHYKPYFTTTQSSKDSQLAVKLINDLKVRGDVRSLCYIPLVCSMVILVYCKEGGQLPTTLTQLYENFILQTIRRHVKRRDTDPHTLGSLCSLPPLLAMSLKELCHIAYTSLASTNLTFTSYQLQKFTMHEAINQDYLGLMTTFVEYDEEKYQFIHLSIQEFLAAWWIVNYENKTEDMFKDHFDNQHFRLCLRFVAGLTRLKHESYQQYFNKKELDLQCKRGPMFQFETFHSSWFQQNPKAKKGLAIPKDNHVSLDNNDTFPILLIQLLYESQNASLCQTLAQSIKNHSLCLCKNLSLSLFDWLCLSYFINNSNTSWTQLSFEEVFDPKMSIFTTGLSGTSLQTQCKRLEVKFWYPTDELIHKFLQPSVLYNIQECYSELDNGQFVPCAILLDFFALPQLKILHITMYRRASNSTHNPDKCSELEKTIARNSTVKEFNISCSGRDDKITSTITSIIKGLAGNKTITSLLVNVSSHSPLPPPLSDGAIEQLLKNNCTLHALALSISDELLPSSLNIAKVNMPLTALELGKGNRKFTTSLVRGVKGLQCLILPEPYQPQPLFCSHSKLQMLIIPLDTAESAIELFTILQTNTTLEALNVSICCNSIYTNTMGTSLQDMLRLNKTLKCFEIDGYSVIPNSFLSYLTTGLKQNNNLQQFIIKHIPLPTTEQIIILFDVLSQKNNLIEIQVYFKLDGLYCNYSFKEKERKMTQHFYGKGLPAITKMLQSNTTIRQLRIVCDSYNNLYEPNSIEVVQLFYETIFTHSSLEYIEIHTIYTASRLLNEYLKHQKKYLAERHEQEQPHRPLPIVIIQCKLTVLM